MPDQEKIRHHAGLFDKTAARVGVDLEEVTLSGKMTFDELAEAVLRCTQCSNPQACAKWLDTPVTENENLPEYCENISLLQGL